MLMKPGAKVAGLLLSTVLLACSSSEPERAEDRNILYMAVGASDAVGIGATPLTNGYVFKIRDELEKGWDVRLLNLGIPGARTGRIEDAVRLALRSGANPDLATVWLGANDLIDGVEADEFQDQLDELLDALEDRTDAALFIADLPDLTQLPRFREDPIASVTRERIEEFNEAIAEEAADHDATLVPLSEEEVEDRYVSDEDGFHPNDAGHRRIADLFLRAIRPRLAAASPPQPGG
jgi:lysophospholipase L1-like esterase